MINNNENTGWASKEFGEIDLGDQRLKNRLVSRCREIVRINAEAIFS